MAWLLLILIDNVPVLHAVRMYTRLHVHVQLHARHVALCSAIRTADEAPQILHCTHLRSHSSLTVARTYSKT